ncbi:phosphomannomutase [Roseibium algae]|uniref:Phosphomannomutase n=1 Tax=Roseibium algae TaxID=3123038 RepID=A0ABU8TRW5_9HYPH
MSLKFGTSGLRGLSAELVGSPSYVYAAAFAKYLLDQNLAASGDRVLIGYDFRDSSPAIAANVRQAVHDTGLVPVDCGTLPTPALAFYGLELGAASTMITGSHIPADRNGIKFYLPSGEITKQDEKAITQRAAGISAPETAAEEVPFEELGKEAVARFMQRNRELLAPEALKGLKVGIYQHSTVARDMLAGILKDFGAETVLLGRSETFIPVDTEAVSGETRAALKSWSSDHSLDAIVSADGDGDRPLIVDETGEPVNGDICGFLAALFLKANRIVTPITSNSGIETACVCAVRRTKVGSPFVIAGMDVEASLDSALVVGFEANGGTLTASDFQVAGGTLSALPTRDCFLPILAVLATARVANSPVSTVTAALGLNATASDRLKDFAQEKSAAIMAWLTEEEGNLALFLKPVGVPAAVDTLDGLRITLEDGSVMHFRPSGNAPEMRCYVEASSPEICKHLLESGLNLLVSFDRTETA